MLFIGTLLSHWLVGYNSRRDALQYIEDLPARDLLIGRHRAANALYQTVPRLPKLHMDYVGAMLADAHPYGLDVTTLSDIPSYGRSFLSLWTEAQNLCLSDKKILAHFWRWRYARPAAWGRIDSMDSKLSRLLRQKIEWRTTSDCLFPWEIAGGRSRLRVRLNDYPDEVMYTLFRGDLPVGDFHDWPHTWDRGEPRAADSINHACLLPRYLRGECKDVWNLNYAHV
jgi:hypothetical protein